MAETPAGRPPSQSKPPLGDLETAPSQHTRNPGPSDPSLQLAVGQRPLPEYELVQCLGRGGFGEVWKAKGPGGFAVALKFIRLSDGGSRVELRSLELMKAIKHPHLLVQFGAWQCHGFLIVAMELADGTLADRLQQARAASQVGLARKEALRYLFEAARGLDHLHSQNVQHRDVKPQNLLLVGGGVKVGDFGLARLIEHSLTSATGSMTMAYAAPELFKNQVSDHTDQYALAVTYCELRGGQRPFEGPPASLITGHLRRPPDLSMLPEEEHAAVTRALAKKPSERWPSCRAFVEALLQVGKPRPGSPLPEPDKPPPDKAPPEPQRPSELKRSGGVREKPALPLRKAPATSGTEGPTDYLKWGSVTAAVLVLVAVVWLSLFRSDPTQTASGPKAEEPRPSAEPGPKSEPPRVIEKKIEGIEKKPTPEPLKLVEKKTKPAPDPPKSVEKNPKPAAAVKTFRNNLGMEFALVPRGSFWMGGGGGKPGEKQVDIPYDFYLGIHEVTQEQWQTVMGRNPSSFSRSGTSRDKVKDVSDADLKRLPIERVSWKEAQEFVSKLNAREKVAGWVYRLPRETEWEYACRGGASSKEDCSWSFYLDKPTNLLTDRQANLWRKEGLGRPVKVGSYQPNRLGIYDMHGNVREWCEDTYSGGQTKVVRGGGWNSTSGLCRAGHRSAYKPEEGRDDIGFRIARVPAGR